MSKRNPGHPRKPRDLYQTPPEAVAPLLPFLKPGTRFAEPCAASGLLVDALVAAGHVCAWAADIQPLRDDVHENDATTCGLGAAEVFVTNPPWRRDLLHDIMVNLSNQAPTFLLFDSDWAYTKQAKPFHPRMRKIITVGRVRWIFEGSKTAGFDNAAWYELGPPMANPTTLFFGKGQAPPADQRRASRICADCGVMIDRFGKWSLQQRNGVPTPVHINCRNPKSRFAEGEAPDLSAPLLDWMAS